MVSNRSGDDVDPVPWLVVVAMGFLICYSFGPLYLKAVLGVTIEVAIAGSTLVFLGIAAGSWYRLVWTRRPEHMAVLGAAYRLERLFYWAVVVALLLLLLALPTL